MRAGEAAWNISTMEHAATPTLSAQGWSGNGLAIEKKDGKLLVRPTADAAKPGGGAIQRRVERTPGFDWLVLKIDQITQPDSGYRLVNLMLNAGGYSVGFMMAGNVPDVALFTLKVPEAPDTGGILRLDTTMKELVISDLGLYDAPLPRLEFVMPDTSDEKVPASSEFTVELRLDAPAQRVSVELFDGPNTSTIQISPGQPPLDLKPADAQKKIWRGKFSLAEAKFLRGPNAAERGSQGVGRLLIKATVEGNAKVPEIWTANSRGIDLTK